MRYAVLYDKVIADGDLFLDLSHYPEQIHLWVKGYACEVGVLASSDDDRESFDILISKYLKFNKNDGLFISHSDGMFGYTPVRVYQNKTFAFGFAAGKGKDFIIDIANRKALGL